LEAEGEEDGVLLAVRTAGVAKLSFDCEEGEDEFS
jgi:hypothetical protein